MLGRAVLDAPAVLFRTISMKCYSTVHVYARCASFSLLLAWRDSTNGESSRRICIAPCALRHFMSECHDVFALFLRQRVSLIWSAHTYLNTPISST